MRSTDDRLVQQAKQAQVERRRITHTLCSPQALAGKLSELVAIVRAARERVDCCRGT